MAQTTHAYTTPSDGVSVPGGIVIPGDVPFACDYGAVFQAQLNRIKTTPEDFATQNGLEHAYLKAVLKGKAAPNAALLVAIEHSSPLSVRELVDPRYWSRVPVQDDSVDSVVVCDAEKSNANTRVYYRRAGPRARKVKFYTYFHTAVQKRSTIIPEKIVEHFEWDPSDRELPDGYFNNGHRERQMTVTVGAVNYHWIGPDGKKHVIETHTGDSNAISPFTRHSFTVPPGKEGYILAVTDLGAIGTPDFRAMVHALGKRGYQNVMRQMLPVDAPASSFDELGGFMFRKYQGNPHRERLMDGITAHPSFIASELFISAPPYGGPNLDVLVDAHVWGYNHGDEPVQLLWGNGHSEFLGTGDSYSVQVGVPHTLQTLGRNAAQVIMMQSNPSQESPLEQLALVHKFRGEEGVMRAASENKLWFKDVKKK